MSVEILDSIENQHQEKDYKIQIECPEFTCLCPEKRDQPDFAVITLIYIPDKYLIELKSLKYYLFGYRNMEIYHEDATNRIYEDLFEALKPRYLKVVGDWNVRGGIKTIVEVESSKENEPVTSHFEKL